MMNAHPLSVRESENLSKALTTKEERDKTFLKPKGIIPTNVLHINPSKKGSLIWYTKAQKRTLYFVESLEIPSGTAYTPPLLWKATKQSLSIYALKSNRRPQEHTKLYYAPFFNVYENSNVCMGSVNIDIKETTSLEDFIQAWETYFFESYFSHLQNFNPINGNCVSIWKQIINTDKPFPTKELKENSKTLKDIL
ncbi:PRTRC system protein B [Ornithobacterium rhinotracheale]|uniref:PRTRC system protein B n=1 Tax=Ornithobacterium rhinotracheale TaxID=28251 RepID=UPI00129C14C0|nr:PRTRC system protein B [Ornithobacterium rhinotracheale]MRJ09334.1 PRTRC system protein B [Ornithobacterium rhinotracheale]UOH77022.1 prokaryotic E2 ligase family D protein [Ornithobacterium rhinotracheale]